MSENLELTTREPLPVARVAESGPLSIEQVFRAVMETDIGPEKVAVMKELLAMSAERQFAAAFVALQSDLPTIVATSVIPNRGKYERFEDVMRQVGPVLTKHGFTVSFSQDFRENRIVVSCFLTHAAGHTRKPNEFAVRAGGKSDSETQADCKASTTAKRNALLQALNIVIRQDCLASDDDAANEGVTITPEQARNLRERVQATGSDERAFLRFAGAESYEAILSGKLGVLDQSLRKKERT